MIPGLEQQQRALGAEAGSGHCRRWESKSRKSPYVLRWSTQQASAVKSAAEEPKCWLRREREDRKIEEVGGGFASVRELGNHYVTITQQGNAVPNHHGFVDD